MLKILHNPKWLGLRRSAVVELILLLGTALALDAAFFDGSRFWSVAPHPFGYIVLLLSLQYGTYEGLLAAALASLALLARNIPAQEVSEDYYVHLYTVVARPLGWTIMALFIGELRRRQLCEREKIQRELAEAQAREAVLQQEYRKAVAARSSLETQVAAEMRTVLGICQAARMMERLQAPDVLAGASELIIAVLNPDKFSIFLLEGAELLLSSRHGWAPDDPFRRAFTTGTPLFDSVITRRRCLCSPDEPSEQDLGPEGVLAGPLIDGSTGEVLGMLKVEALGFLDLTIASVQKFRLLSEWIGTAYGSALRYHDACREGEHAASAQ